MGGWGGGVVVRQTGNFFFALVSTSTPLTFYKNSVAHHPAPLTQRPHLLANHDSCVVQAHIYIFNSDVNESIFILIQKTYLVEGEIDNFADWLQQSGSSA